MEKVLDVNDLEHLHEVGNIPTIWITSTFARDWFEDAFEESRSAKSRKSIRREIIFSVLFAESYLVEWVRGDILKSDFKTFFEIFEPGKKYSAKEKWKDIPKKLKVVDKIQDVPNLKNTFWVEFSTLVDYRDGLAHAAASIPDTTSAKKAARAVPTPKQLDDIEPGWAINVAIELVKEFHKAANLPLPNWFFSPSAK